MLDQLRRMRGKYEKLIQINFCVVCGQDCEIVLAREPRDFACGKCRAGRETGAEGPKAIPKRALQGRRVGKGG